MLPGHGAEHLGVYMRRRKRWQELRQLYEESGGKLVLYSARLGYAHRAHLICELLPKVAAAAMVHSLETHLASDSKWCGDDVVDTAFQQAASRLDRISKIGSCIIGRCTTKLNCQKRKESIKKCYRLKKSRMLNYYVGNSN